MSVSDVYVLGAAYISFPLRRSNRRLRQSPEAFLTAALCAARNMQQHWQCPCGDVSSRARGFPVPHALTVRHASVDTSHHPHSARRRARDPPA